MVQQESGHDCPIVDTWWQTETGGIMISGLGAHSPQRPTYAGRPLPGITRIIGWGWKGNFRRRY